MCTAPTNESEHLQLQACRFLDFPFPKCHGPHDSRGRSCTMCLRESVGRMIFSLQENYNLENSFFLMAENVIEKKSFVRQIVLWNVLQERPHTASPPYSLIAILAIQALSSRLFEVRALRKFSIPLDEIIQSYTKSSSGDLIGHTLGNHAIPAKTISYSRHSTFRDGYCF